jgi:glutathione S-transferase
MQLYTSPVSPFSERVRIALTYKKVPYEPIKATREILDSAEFLALNPIKKIPVLVTDAGLAIAESETVLDYIEDAYPEPPLKLRDPAEAARMRMAIRTFENYVAPPVFRLFEHMDPKTAQKAVIDDEVRRWRRGLSLLAGKVDDARYAVGGRLSLADCVVLPGLVLCEMIAGYYKLGDLIGEQPKLAGYYAKSQAEPLLKQAHDDLLAAAAAHYAEMA